MIIAESQWQIAYENIEDYRAGNLKRLLSGNCEPKEYGKICGILEGLDVFENYLKEARKPRKKETEEDGLNVDET